MNANSGTVKKIYSQLLLTGAMLIGGPSWAAPNDSEASGSGIYKGSYTNVLSYSVSTDLAEHSKEQTYYHGFSYGGSYDLWGRYFAEFGVAASYISVEEEIVEQDHGVMHLSDISLSVGTQRYFYGQAPKGMTVNPNTPKGRAAMRQWQNNHKVIGVMSIGNTFPLSVRSQEQGYRARPFTQGSVIWQKGVFTMMAMAEALYVVNEYRDNTEGAANPQSQGSIGGGFGISYMAVTLSTNYHQGVRRFEDGTGRGFSGNKITLAVNLGNNVSASISTGNVNLANDPFVDLWFFNPYQRSVNFNLGVAF